MRLACTYCHLPAAYLHVRLSDPVEQRPACIHHAGNQPKRLPHVGPGMIEAATYVTEHPGCSKRSVAKAVGPRGSQGRGYEIVDRAIAAGLIHAEVTADAYVLSVTPLGRAARPWRPSISTVRSAS